jgi:hypothetical protein
LSADYIDRLKERGLSEDALLLLALVFKRDTHVDLRAFKKGEPEHVAMVDSRAKNFLEQVADFAKANADRDVYFGVAGRDGRGRGNLNLARTHALWVDVDYKLTNFEEVFKRIALFEAAGIPPTAIVETGGGLHLYWSLRRSLRLDDEDARSGVRDVLRLLARAAGEGGDLSAAEPARILRLPGTYNRKPEYGEPRLVKVVGGREDVDRAGMDDEQALRAVSYPLEEIVEGLGWFFDAGILTLEERSAAGGKAAPLPDAIGEKRNVTLTSEAGRLRNLRHSEAEILASLLAINRERCRPPLEEREVEGIARSVARYSPGQAPPVRHVVLKSALEFAPRAARWLWDGRIPEGALALLTGREGHGKSSVAYDLIARVTQGQLPGESFGRPRAVVVAATEDAWAQVIVPRLMAAGADLGKVYRADVVKEDMEAAGQLDLPRDLDALEAAIREQDVALVLLDPIISRLNGALDTHKDQHVRQGLERLNAIGERSGCAFLGVIHLNKTATTDPLTAIMGSRAFAAVARAALFVAQESVLEGVERTLAFPKNNYGPTARSRTFKIETANVGKDTDGRDILTSRVVWGAETERTARDILEAAQESRKATNTPRKDARAWLEKRLQGKGAVSSAVLKDEAASEEISERTLKRAQRDLGLEVAYLGKGGTTWALPALRKGEL